MMMPGADDNTALMSLPPPPSSITEKVPSCTTPPEYDANDDVAVQEQQQQQPKPFKDTSAEIFAQAQRVSAASDVYFSQFLALLEEEVDSVVLKQKHQQKANTTLGPSLGPRFHACSCVDCLQLLYEKKGTIWRALPDCITTTLPYSGLRVELLSCGSIHLTGPYLSLFIGGGSGDQNSITPTTVVVNFHGTSKVLLRCGGGGGGGGGNGGGKEGGGDNPQQQLRNSSSCEVDILSGPYTVALRPGQASLSSSANVLTYVIDKAGTTKTKIIKQHQQQKSSENSSSSSWGLSLASEEDQVLKAVQQALTGGRAKWQAETKKKKQLRLKEVAEKEKEKEKEVAPPVAPLKFTRKWTLPKEKKGQQQQQQNNFWTFEDGLTIHDQADGTLQLYYSIGSKSKKSQQLQQQMNEPQANPLQLLVNSQHLYLQQQQQVIVLDHTGHLFVGSSTRRGGKGGGGGGGAQEKEKLTTTTTTSFPSPFTKEEKVSPFSPQHSLAQVCAQLAPTTAHTFDCHRKLSQQTTGQVNGGGGSKQVNACLNLSPPKPMMIVAKDGGEEVAKKVLPIVPALSPVPANFSLPSLLSACEQYALGGPGSGLLVKHRHRRAGLNSRNLICLL